MSAARPTPMTERYQLSFTVGGLFLHEAPILIERYLASGDWSTTRQAVHRDNLFQVRTAAAATRLSRELITRLAMLDRDELCAVLTGADQERGDLLWAATCRRYAFIHDLAVELLRESYLLRRGQLLKRDYEAFYTAKALAHPELDELKPSTQCKLRQNLFRMLREARLLSDQSEILPAALSPALARLLGRRGPAALLIFPATDREITQWLQ